MQNCVVIPARYYSERLPEKVLLDICGKPLTQRVFERAKQAQSIDDVFIATDSEKVEEYCKSFTENVLITSMKHTTGSDRVAETMNLIDAEFVVNVQGDELLIEPSLIDNLFKTLNESKAQMVSAMHRLSNFNEFIDPNIVKVVVDVSGNAISFSRSPIPYPRDEQYELVKGSLELKNVGVFFRHIGVYGYTKNFLQKFASMQTTPIERLEKLEQYRVIENGFQIKMIETKYEPIGVDTVGDLERVREIIRKRN